MFQLVVDCVPSVGTGVYEALPNLVVALTKYLVIEERLKSVGFIAAHKLVNHVAHLGVRHEVQITDLFHLLLDEPLEHHFVFVGFVVERIETYDVAIYLQWREQ